MLIMKILTVLIAESFCIVNPEINPGKEIERKVEDSIYLAIDRIFNENQRYKYNKNVDQIPFIKRSLRIIWKCGGGNTSLLELFPLTNEIEFTKEYVGLGFFIEFLRVIFSDNCCIDEKEFSDYKYRTTAFLIKNTEEEAVDYVYDRLNGRIGLFSRHSSRILRKRGGGYWKLEDGVFDECENLANDRQILLDFIDKNVKTGDFILIKEVQQPEDILRDTPSNVDDTVKAKDEDSSKKNVVTKEYADYDYPRDYLERKNQEKEKEMLANDKMTSSSAATYLISSHYITPLVFKAKISEKSNVIEEISRSYCSLNKQAKREGRLILTNDEAFYSIRLMLGVFKMLSFYTNESIKVMLRFTESQVLVNYMIDSNIYKLCTNSNYKSTNPLMILNQISHINMEENRIVNRCHRKIVDFLIRECREMMLSEKPKNHRHSSFNPKTSETQLRDNYNLPSIEHCVFGYKEEFADLFTTPSIDGKVNEKPLVEIIENLYKSIESDDFSSYTTRVKYLTSSCLENIKSNSNGNFLNQAIVDEYLSVPKYNDSNDLSKQLKVYTKKYKSIVKHVQGVLDHLINEDKCKGIVNILTDYLENPTHFEKSAEHLEIKLLLSLALYFDVTFEVTVISSVLQLKELIDRSEDTTDLPKSIINTIKVNRLKNAYMVQICLKRALDITKYLLKPRKIVEESK